MDKPIDVYAVVTKLTGPLTPVGETREDERRLANLETAIYLADKLLSDIHDVALEKHRPEHSIAKAGKCASDFIYGLEDYLNNG